MRPFRLFHGPHIRLPRPVDAVADRWAGLPPRVRVLVTVGLGLVLIVGGETRIRMAEQHWGGPAVGVLVAGEDLEAGTAPTALRTERVPPAVAPPSAVTEVPDGAVLAAPLPRGAVLTSGHLDPRGPAATLPPDLRAVPIPVEEGWSVTAGGWVDVWVLATNTEPAVLVAGGRPVLEVTDDAHERIALVGLHVDEVGAAGVGLARGQLLLTHAPVSGMSTDHE